MFPTRRGGKNHGMRSYLSRMRRARPGGIGQPPGPAAGPAGSRRCHLHTDWRSRSWSPRQQFPGSRSGRRPATARGQAVREVTLCCSHRLHWVCAVALSEAAFGVTGEGTAPAPAEVAGPRRGLRRVRVPDIQGDRGAQASQSSSSRTRRPRSCRTPAASAGRHRRVIISSSARPWPWRPAPQVHEVPATGR